MCVTTQYDISSVLCCVLVVDEQPVCCVLNWECSKCALRVLVFFQLARCVNFLLRHQDPMLLSTVSYNAMHTQVMRFRCSFLLVFPFCLPLNAQLSILQLTIATSIQNDLLFAKKSHEILEYNVLHPHKDIFCRKKMQHISPKEHYL